MAETILPFPTHISAWRRGADLAFRMLRDLEACDLEETAYDTQFREGRPQRNYLAAYLAKVREAGDPRCEIAFTAILTDYIASSMHAGEPNLDVCQRLYGKMPVATEPPEMRP